MRLIIFRGKKQRAEHYSHNPYYYPPMEAKYNGSEGKATLKIKKKPTKTILRAGLQEKNIYIFTEL